MPNKTNSELIRELSNAVTTLVERERALRRAGKRRAAKINRLTESLTALSTRVALLEHPVGELRKTAEESGHRRWSLLPPLLAVIIGGIITLLGQLLLSYLQK